MTTVNLNGSATDDGLPNPPSALTYLWTKESGPGDVTFGDATNPITTATFSLPGVYVLRLTADDSALTGFDELTITIDESTFVPPLPGDSSVYYGDMKAYIFWDGSSVLRTWDLQAASPVWELVDTGVTGEILDGQYMHVDASTVGMWLLTEDGVWFCADIMAVTPSWSLKLDVAYIVANEVQPPSGASSFASMFHYWLEPGNMFVITQPGTGSDASSYLHAYTYHTHDYGANWTQVDMSAFQFTSNSLTRCYCFCALFGTNVFRSENIIWAARFTARTPSSGNAAVFKSVDGGHIWTMEFDFSDPTAQQTAPSLLNPFPSITDPSYIGFGIGSTGDALLYRSTDAWATSTLLTRPAGYDHLHSYMNEMQRMNKRTFDNTHVMAIWRVGSAGSIDLLESYDQGVTWSVLKTGISNGSQTPNGWPPDVDQWIMFDTTNAGITTTSIRLTLDNFVNMLDKKGNLASVLPGGVFDTGIGGGFALPRVAPND